VAEVWNISKPKQDSGLAIDQRVIQIGKSRINRSGETLIQTQNDDLTVSLVEAKKPKEIQTRAGTVAERIMNRLQTSNQPLSRHDLNADPLVGGSVSAIKKTLQRLENRGVVEVIERTSHTNAPEKFYSALRAWGESVRRRTGDENPVEHSISKGDTEAGTSSCPPPLSIASETEGDTPPPQSECPPSELSAGAGSDPEGTLDLCPRAGEERSPEEMRALNNAAWNEFDLDL
jgi:ribosomal protein S25